MSTSTVKTHLIGIDPSLKTAGVCIYEPATGAMTLHTGDLFSCVAFLNACGLLRRCIVVLEDPNLDSTSFDQWLRFKRQIEGALQKRIGLGELKSDFAISMNFAQSVGKSKASADVFRELLERQGVPCLLIAPSSRHRADKDVLKLKTPGIALLKMPTKTTAEQFRQLTGYAGRSSEHARDAATLVHGRTVAWATMQIRIQEETKAKKDEQRTLSAPPSRSWKR